MSRNALPLGKDSHTGKQLGKYEVVCRLSEGGMASIFLAMAKGVAGFRKLVVLKKILPVMAVESDFVRRFLDEARVMAGFSHPNIAQVFDLDQQGKDYFLAMEFVPGASLVEIVNACIEEKEAMPVGLALASARDTGLALHYAHTYVDPLGEPRRIIHRDVAPKNIMVTYDGTTKLLDFGIAKTQEGGGGLTGMGMVIGTPGYMSPEQAVGHELDPRSDVFSLGVTLFECLTGRRLYARATPEEEMRAPFEVDPPLPSSLNKKIPLRIDSVVLKALAKKREDRYGSALELAKAIDQVGGELVWASDKRGALIQRLFSDRRVQTRKLVQAVQEAQEVDQNTVINFPAFATTDPIHPPQGVRAQAPAPPRAAPASPPRPRAPDPERTDITVPSAPAFKPVRNGKKPFPDTRPGRGSPPREIALGSGRGSAPDTNPDASAIQKEGVWLVWVVVPLLAAGALIVLARGLYNWRAANRENSPQVQVVAPPMGKLSLDTDPRSIVRVNGTSLGRTPLVEVPLAEGPHLLTLDALDGGVTHSLPVDIRADSPMHLKFRLDELPELEPPH